MNIIYKEFKEYTIKETSNFLRNNNLYEKSKTQSRFRTISENPDLNVFPNYHGSSKIVTNHFSGVVALCGAVPIGILLYENFDFLESIHLRGKKNENYFQYSAKGGIGVYVEDSYRKNNIANEMMSVFNVMFLKHYYNDFKDKDYVVLAANGICLDIAKKQLVGITISDSFSSPLIWKDNCCNANIKKDSLLLVHDIYQMGGDFSTIVKYIKENQDDLQLSENKKIKNTNNGLIK